MLGILQLCIKAKEMKIHFQYIEKSHMQRKNDSNLRYVESWLKADHNISTQN